MLNDGTKSWRNIIFLFYTATWIARPMNSTQRFRETPTSVLVPEGHFIELRCAVDDQRGRVQWTKDGFALGFERNVPGYPRYHYKGQAAKGEHHLVIAETELTDDGEFQCQVGPTHDTDPIWVAANVTVLVPPAYIGIAGFVDGSLVRVPSGKPFTLECLIENARPAPSATWYRAGMQIEKTNQEDIFEHGINPRLITVRSKLFLTAVPSDDGQQYSCRGHHPALTDTLTALVATVTLSVLHHPKPPIIKGYTGKSLITGETIDISCLSEGGVPRPKVVWYSKEKVIDDSFSIQEKFVVNDLLLKVSSREDNTIIECRVFNEFEDYVLTATVALSVLYPPSGVHIKAPSIISIGQELKLVCQSLPSNPKVQLRWIIENKRIASNTSTWTKLSEGGWITSSKINGFIVTDETSHDGSHMTVLCEAISPITDRITSEEVVINIVRPPEPPLLDGFNNEIDKGSRVSVSCYSRGGNPVPTMKLFKGEEELRSDLRLYENVTEVFSEFYANHSDNQKLITCRLFHPSFQDAMEVSERLNVLSSPSYVTITVSPKKVELGNEVSLVCESSSSNPPADISWHTGDHLIIGNIKTLQVEDNIGEKTRSELLMKATVEEDQKMITCKASNGLDSAVEETVTLNVLHSPVWLSVPSEIERAVEGERLSLQVDASGNPGPVSYNWMKEGTSLNITKNSLDFFYISRNNSGFYSVSASTPRRMINSSFRIDVRYPAQITYATDILKLQSKMNGIIECIAEGNPFPLVTWSSLYSEVTLSSGINSTTFRIKEATPSHAQEVQCEASNNIGLIQRRKGKIIIEHGALLLRTSGLSWVERGHDALLLCHARADPRPEFRWASSQGQMDIAEPLFAMTQFPILLDNLNLWLSIVNVSNYKVNEEFHCAVRNNLGEDFGKMRISYKENSLGKLEVQNMTSSSATFSLRTDNDLFETVDVFYLIILNLDNLLSQKLQVFNDTICHVENLSAEVTFLVILYGGYDSGPINFIGPSLVFSLKEKSAEISTGNWKDSMNIGRLKIPRLVLLITTLTGVSLLIVNIAIITCYLKARRKTNKAKDPPIAKDKNQLYNALTSPSDENFEQLVEKESVAIEKPLMESAHSTPDKVLFNSNRRISEIYLPTKILLSPKLGNHIKPQDHSPIPVYPNKITREEITEDPLPTFINHPSSSYSQNVSSDSGFPDLASTLVTRGEPLTNSYNSVIGANSLPISRTKQNETLEAINQSWGTQQSKISDIRSGEYLSPSSMNVHQNCHQPLQYQAPFANTSLPRRTSPFMYRQMSMDSSPRYFQNDHDGEKSSYSPLNPAALCAIAPKCESSPYFPPRLYLDCPCNNSNSSRCKDYTTLDLNPMGTASIRQGNVTRQQELDQYDYNCEECHRMNESLSYKELLPDNRFPVMTFDEKVAYQTEKYQSEPEEQFIYNDVADTRRQSLQFNSLRRFRGKHSYRDKTTWNDSSCQDSVNNSMRYGYSNFKPNISEHILSDDNYGPFAPRSVRRCKSLTYDHNFGSNTDYPPMKKETSLKKFDSLRSQSLKQAHVTFQISNNSDIVTSRSSLDGDDEKDSEERSPSEHEDLESSSSSSEETLALEQQFHIYFPNATINLGGDKKRSNAYKD